MLKNYSIYQFEAVQIQDYILSSGKMKIMVGASELLEAVTNSLLLATLDQLGLKETLPKDLVSLGEDNYVFPRKSGGVFQVVMTDEKKAKTFAEIWPILVSGFAPGLRFSASLRSGGDFNEVAKKVRQDLNRQKNTPQTMLPESTPITQRFQKTGQAQLDPEHDWTMLAKDKIGSETLALKHLSENNRDTYVFPKQFEHKHTEGYWREAFPFKTTEEGNHTVAVIHTDGNGLGEHLHKIFSELNNENDFSNSIKAYADFSQGLDNATQLAAQKATDWLIEEYAKENNPYKEKLTEKPVTPLPMRPLILGGDDLTCIVRADLAFGFVKTFTQAFQDNTAQFIDGIKKRYSTIFSSLPSELTCTTGMVFIKSNQPFAQGYSLAESLCSLAKDKGRQYVKQSGESSPSLVNFLYTTNTLFDNARVQIAQELEVGDDNPEFVLSQMPYSVFSHQSFACLDELFELSTFFNDQDDSLLNTSAIRNYASKLHQGRSSADVFWTRWKNLSTESTKSSETWKAFEERWGNMTTESIKPVADLNTLFSLKVVNPYWPNQNRTGVE